MRANYAGGVALIDDQIGEILDVLRSRNELDDTVVVFASDHGEMNGDQGLIYKSTFFEPAIRVPLIVRLPPSGHGLRGLVSDAVVELIDLAATFVDLAGGRLPPSFSGRSLRPMLEGRQTDWRQLALIELDHHYCLVGPRWKVEFAPDLSPVSAFDLETDPAEQLNVIVKFDDAQMWTGLLNEMLARTPTSPPPATIELFARTATNA